MKTDSGDQQLDEGEPGLSPVVRARARRAKAASVRTAAVLGCRRISPPAPRGWGGRSSSDPTVTDVGDTVSEYVACESRPSATVTE